MGQEIEDLCLYKAVDCCRQARANFFSSIAYNFSPGLLI